MSWNAQSWISGKNKKVLTYFKTLQNYSTATAQDMMYDAISDEAAVMQHRWNYAIFEICNTQLYGKSWNTGAMTLNIIP